jgi:thioredoxin 1
MEVTITDSNLKDYLAQNKPVVVDFWATWCGPCRQIAPLVEELANEFEGRALIGKCNVDENVELPTEYGIRNIPTLLFFKNGELVDKQIGATAKEVLRAKIEALL